MPSRRSLREVRRAQRERAARRLGRVTMLLLLLAVVLATLVLTAFGAVSPAPQPRPAAAPARIALGPPAPQLVAVRGPLQLQLPVAQASVTAIGYHAAGPGALPLEPLGRRGNGGVLSRLADRILGRDDEGLVWYQLGGGRRATSALAVGASPGTDVYAPVDGTVVAVSDFVLSGRVYGARIDLRPAAAPALVVSVTRLRPDPALAVGVPVTAATSRLGTVLDLSAVERHALARYTQDAGNHVTIEVRPATGLTLP